MFFGSVRQSCDDDGHPSTKQFVYVYRLASVNSLIKTNGTCHGSVVSDQLIMLRFLRRLDEITTEKHVMTDDNSNSCKRSSTVESSWLPVLIFFS